MRVCLLLPLLMALLGLFAACRREPQLNLLPVAGEVTLGERALTSGTISLRPDASRGNSSLHHPTGSIDRAGHFQVFTVGRPGAPPGAYKVVIFATEELPGGAGVHPGMPRSLIAERYNSPVTTPLSVEVREPASAEAYHFRLEP